MRASSIKREVLRMEHIVAYHGDAKVLDHARLNMFEKEVLGVTGLTGSGKSALIKCITGMMPHYSGEVYYQEKAFHSASIEYSRSQGIFYIQPESSLINDFSVAENLFFSKSSNNIFFNRKKIEKKSAEFLALMKLDIHCDSLVSQLSYRKRILLEICKALVNDAQIIILDNVLSTILSSTDKEYLSQTIQLLHNLSINVIIIEPGIKALQLFCDRIFVLRKGQTVGVFGTDQLDEDQMLSLMIGKKIQKKLSIYEHKKELVKQEVSLAFQNIYYDHILRGISFELHQKEILGILNVNKNSGAAIQKILLGTGQPLQGDILINGRKVSLSSPEKSLATGISIVGESNLLFKELSLKDNLTLSSTKKTSRLFGILNPSELKYIESEIRHEYFPKNASIKLNPSLPLSWLIQKKIALCRALASEPKLIVLMNPTQYIDMISRQEIFDIITKVRDSGVSSLLISSDIDELAAICDRILVISQGKITDETPVSADTLSLILQKYSQYLRDI